MRKNSFSPTKGFSIVEVLVALGILGFVAMAVLSLTTGFQKQNKGLVQKLEVLELEQGVLRLMTDNTTCNCLFQNIPLAASQTSVTLVDGLKSSCLPAGSPSTPIAKANMKLESGLKILSVKIENINPVSPTAQTADIIIDFDPDTSASVAPKPIKIQGQTFKWDGSKIEGCLGIAGQKEMCEGMGGNWSGLKCDWPLPPAVASCTALGGTWDQDKCSFQPGTSTLASTAAPPPSLCPAFTHSESCNGISGGGATGVFTIPAGKPYGSVETVYLEDGSCDSVGPSTIFLCGTMQAQCTNGVWQVLSASCTKGND